MKKKKNPGTNWLLIAIGGAALVWYVSKAMKAAQAAAPSALPAPPTTSPGDVQPPQPSVEGYLGGNYFITR